jgi:hypothetical protein
MLSRLKHAFFIRMARRKFAPNIEAQPISGLVRFGSAYGGWVFDPSNDLHDSTVVSCGLRSAKMQVLTWKWRRGSKQG